MKMRDSTERILKEHKIKVENIKYMRTYGLINDPLNPGAAKNMYHSFGLGLKLKYRGYIQLDISDCTKRELLHLKIDLTELLERIDDGKV